MTAVELKEQLAKSWDEFRLLTTDESVELQMDPTDESEVKKKLLRPSDPYQHPKTSCGFHPREKRRNIRLDLCT